jgi:hypothetical protein
MNILIGTPIHICKDYCMERWLENVATLQRQTPADLLLVDNSPGLEYVEKVKGYCAKYGITKYRIEHMEFDQGMSREKSEERIRRAQEIIRKEMLSGDYDAWFSWECDQLIPPNALDELVRMMKTGDFMIVVHNSWMRETPASDNFDMGCTLIKKECLEKHDFLQHWDGEDVWFKERVLSDEGNYIEVEGVINPIYHLNS